MKRFVALAAVAMLAAACGASSGSPGTPTPTSGGLGFDYTATNTDHQVAMHVGQKLEVVLHAAQGMNNWSHPTSSDESVLKPIVDPAATAAVGVTLAAFQAMKAGEVDVTSNATPRCSPGQACPMYIALYQLKVVVTT
ncbi:MAG TPA: hypothetical protein VFL27_05520 [Candidatus Dormibacteraeota bacterium]|nr:hypothetical protein [Candidatus Dormibacteraeota bacterium]